MTITSDVKVRFGYIYDLEKITTIANQDGFEWPDKEILETLKKPLTVCIVAVDDLEVLGFCIYNLEIPDAFTILHLAVDSKCHRQGIGQVLINKMKQKMEVNDHRNEIVYALPESNLKGQLFLQKMEFVGKLIASYPEDIIEFAYKKVGYVGRDNE